MPKITPDITKEAKQVYDNLPETVHKGKWVSDAIVEKHSRNTSFEARLEQLEKEVKALKDRIGGKV